MLVILSPLLFLFFIMTNHSTNFTSNTINISNKDTINHVDNNNPVLLSIPFLNEIYHSDLLLNQYIIQTNGFFLFELEKHITLDTHRILKLGNPYTLFYLSQKRKIGYFFDSYVPKFIFDTTYNIQKLLFLNNCYQEFHSPVFTHLNTCWHYKTILSQKQKEINTLNPFVNTSPDQPLKIKEDSQPLNVLPHAAFPEYGFLSEKDAIDLFLFHSSYPKFRNLFYPNKPFDDDLSFDDCFFIQKRDVVEEYENSSFFTTIDLMFSQFFSSNSHLNLLSPLFVEDINATEKILTDYIQQYQPNYQHITSTHPNVQKAIQAKKFDISSFNSLKTEHSELVSQWMENPAKIFYSFKDKTRSKVAIQDTDFSFLKKDLLGNPLTTVNQEETIFFHLLYMSPQLLADHLMLSLNTQFTDNKLNFSYDTPLELINAIINNQFFFMPNSTTSPNLLSNKSLPVNKKIWDIFLSECTSFDQNILNYFIFQSYSQENETKLQFSLELSQFQQSFFLPNNTDKTKSPLNYFYHLTRGIQFYSVFNLEDSFFTEKDLHIIQEHNINLFSLVPLLGVSFFDNQLPQVQEVFKNVLANNLKKINLNSDLKNYDFTHQYLSFLSPFNLLNIKEPVLRHFQEHTLHSEQIKDILSDTSIKNTAFIEHLTKHIIYSHSSFNLLDHTNISNRFPFCHNFLTVHFYKKNLSTHQQILNRPSSSLLDVINLNNFIKKSHYISEQDIDSFITTRQEKITLANEDFNYLYLNSLFQKSLSMFLFNFLENIGELDSKSIQHSLNHSNFFSNIEFLNPLRNTSTLIPFHFFKDKIFTPEYLSINNSIEREVALRNHLQSNKIKNLNDEQKTRKKI